MTNEIIVYDEKPMSIQDIKDQMKSVNELYKEIMVKDVHYGIIPGTKKDTLLKPGAEKLVTMFQLAVKVESEKKTDLGNGHREIEIIIGLYSKKTNILWGEGLGSCSTMESKFRYREDFQEEGTVPRHYWDNKDAPEYKGLKTKKINGIWMFGKSLGKVENPDIADVYNTVLKMAYKRSLISATISATGISDIFTQDMEDFLDKGNGTKPQAKTTTAQQGQPEQKPELNNGLVTIVKINASTDPTKLEASYKTVKSYEAEYTKSGFEAITKAFNKKMAELLEVK